MKLSDINLLIDFNLLISTVFQTGKRGYPRNWRYNQENEAEHREDGQKIREELENSIQECRLQSVSGRRSPLFVNKRCQMSGRLESPASLFYLEMKWIVNCILLLSLLSCYRLNYNFIFLLSRRKSAINWTSKICCSFFRKRDRKMTTVAPKNAWFWCY